MKFPAGAKIFPKGREVGVIVGVAVGIDVFEGKGVAVGGGFKIVSALPNFTDFP